MITVFGSINIDVSVAAARLPAPGETVLGGAALLAPGGKGANQAHAARRAGATVALFGAVGDDVFATPALAALRGAGVDLSGVRGIAGQSTGLALIVLDAAGENTIVVAPGANLCAHAGQVPDHALAAAGTLLLQLETDVGSTMALARRARGLGCRVILNASPRDVSGLLDLAAVDTVIVNRDEVRQLARDAGIIGAVDGDGDAGTPAQLAVALARHHRNEVLVTLGADGALLADASGVVISAPAFAVAVVDTTGAGDTFAGAYAAQITDGATRERALAFAGAAAALACTARGAQTAQPRRADIEQLLASRANAPAPPPHPGEQA